MLKTALQRHMQEFRTVFFSHGVDEMSETTNSQQPAARRERLVAALRHREPDRVPILLGGPECSIHQQAHQNLLHYLGYKPVGSPLIIDNILQIVEADMRLYEHFDVDALSLVPREAPVEWESGGETYVDEFGRRFWLGGGFYNQTDHPLNQGTLAELAQYKFPDLTMHNIHGCKNFTYPQRAPATNIRRFDCGDT